MMSVADGAHLPKTLNMDISPPRPNSVLARGVQITEYGDCQINPEPVPLDESDLILHQYLSPRKLCLLGGVDDLDDISKLELKVDTSEMSLGNFGSLLPNLTELKLSNSNIHSIRDLGSCLNGLKILWMSQCNLQDLDGIGSFSNLSELYLAFNEISEVSSVSMLENLQILDLEGNNIDSLSQVQYLAFCMKLTILTLEGNPVCLKPSPELETEEYNYRQSVFEAIPQLECLDDQLLSDGDCKKNVNVFHDDWLYMEKLQEDAFIQEAMAMNDAEENENQSFFMSFRPATGIKPYSPLRPSTAVRPFSSRTRPKTSASKNEILRPFSAMASIQSEELRPTTDSVSELTDGSVVCGNPTRALLSRSKQKTAPPGDPKPLFPQFSFTPEHTYGPVPTADEDLTEVLEQLQQWKVQHEKRLKEIADSWAPQVLKIDPGEYVEESDEEQDLDDEDDIFLCEETISTLSNTKAHGRESEKLNEACKIKETSYEYDDGELVNAEMDDQARNLEPFPPSRPPMSPPLACRSKMLKPQSMLPNRSDSAFVLTAKKPIIKEQITPAGQRLSSDTKTFPRPFLVGSATNRIQIPSLLPSLPSMKSGSTLQKKKS